MSREVEVVALVGRQRLVAGVAQDVEAFGVRLHQAVLDPVVDHLHEVAGARRTAMQVATLRRGSPCLRVRREGGMPDSPGASDAKIGSRRETASTGPPTIRQ